MTKVGYNIHGDSFVNRTKLKTHLNKANTSFNLVLENDGLARELTPFSNIISRHYPDGGLSWEDHPDYQPAEDWFQRYSGDEGIYLYTTNEPLPHNSHPDFPAKIEALLEWHYEVMSLAERTNQRLCVLNIGLGKLEVEHMPLLYPIVERINARPDLFILGLHEYAGGVITSGIEGETLINPNTWPTKERLEQPFSVYPTWHCGRFRMLKESLLNAGIPFPRTVITEFGFDRLDDISRWQQSLIKTSGFPDIRGWKTLPEQWRSWWPTWGTQQAMAEQYLWAEHNLYNSVEGLTIFAWTNAPRWQPQFDISNANFYQNYMEDALFPEEPPIEEPPVEEEPPIELILDEEQLTLIEGNIGSVITLMMTLQRMLSK